jgi:hypothetical protein
MLTALSSELITLLSGSLAFFFTVGILSYMLGDNPLYRLALHLFIGVSVGYVALVILHQVLTPRLILPLLSDDSVTQAVAVVPLALFVFLVFKLSPGTSRLGSISVAYLIGVGAAVALGGALTGTLIPQVQASWTPPGSGSSFQIFNQVLILVGTLSTFLYFQFWVRRPAPDSEAERSPVMQVIATTGQGFLVITLGTVYGGMVLAGLAVLSQSLIVAIQWVTTFLPG